MKAAIKAQCLECMGWSRKDIDGCTDLACPLYPYRPFQAVPWKACKRKKGTTYGFQKKVVNGS
jgi:hypothetical protein